MKSLKGFQCPYIEQVVAASQQGGKDEGSSYDGHSP